VKATPPRGGSQGASLRTVVLRSRIAKLLEPYELSLRSTCNSWASRF